MRSIVRWDIGIALAAGLCVPALAQLTVTSTQPALNGANVDRTTAIVVNFDRAVDRTTFAGRNFGAFGRWSGPVLGPVTFSNGDRTVTLTPSRPFGAGESVMVVLSHNLRG